MNKKFTLNLICALIVIGIVPQTMLAQSSFKLKFKKSEVYAGIEVGSKGVKMTVMEVGKNAQHTGTFNMLKDTSVNTDFISFNESSFKATLNGLTGLFYKANKEFNIPSENIFTVISSGIVVQSEKEGQTGMVKAFADSFKLRVKEPNRSVALVDVTEEARLSHLGIVPQEKRYSTFLIDIGSGNTKGGYFPNGNTTDLKLFQLTWGTKSAANAAEKRMTDDKSLPNFKKQLYRVIEGSADSEVVYAVNVSGAYNMSDNIAFSGGIAWAAATLILPELLESPVVAVTYDDVLKFSDQVFENYNSFNEEVMANKITDKNLDKAAIATEIGRVNKVFDQRALMSGVGLLLKIMRQFEGVYEKKQFFLVKSGHVGWISAYVDQHIGQ